MQYEPIKKVLGKFFNKNIYSRIIFYRLLDFMMIKTWHIHRQLGTWAKKRGNSAHILDAAGGFGHYTYYLSQKNIHWNILSVDINTEQVCDCNTFFQKLKRHNVVFKSMNLENMEDENAFDLILSIGVLEYIEDDEVVLKNFYKALKDGGMLLITTPSLRSKNPSTTEQVRRGYGKKELEKQLKELGFKHVKARYIVGIMGKFSNLLSLKIPVYLVSISKLFLFLMPIYLLVFIPLILVLNFLDTVVHAIYGHELLINAWK